MLPSMSTCGGRPGAARLGVGVALAFVLVLTACSDTGFVGRRVDNFTAFYNTFHNANLAYEKGVDQLDDRNRPVDRTVYLSLFLQPPEGGSGAEAFEKAINKSADVLREHPTSKWVDDALLLIGKSYYFQGNDVGAEQKFREVVDLETGKEGEARFWLARVLVSSGQFEKASQLLNASLADEQEDFGTWTDRMRLARAQLYVRQQRWTEAEEALESGLAGDVPDDLEARAAFLLGQVQETQGKPGDAAVAYQEAANAGPRYELRFAAEISAIRTLGEEGRPEEALDRLEGVARDDKNYEKRFEVRLLKARLQQRAGRPDEAKRTLRELLYGEETPQSTVAARAHHAFGVLYRDAFANFSRAAAHFDTAATTLSRPSGRQERDLQRSPAAITNSQDLADRYGSLAERGEMVARLDSLIRLGEMPREEFRAFIADLREQRRAEQEAEARSRAERQAADRFRSQGARFEDQRNGSDGFSQQQAAATQSSDAGFLFHRDAARVQEGKRSFQRRWSDRPLVDHWRRIEAVRGQGGGSEETAGGPGAASPGAGSSGAAGPGGRPGETVIDVAAVPRDSARLAETRAKRARAQYEFGNALFLAANRPDSAATWYQRILTERPDAEVAQQALYALAEVRRAQGQTDAARRLYERLVRRYPETRFAERARSRLGRTDRAGATADTAAVAASAYRHAYQDWTAGRLDTALVGMLSVARSHPATAAAPKGLLAGSMIYLEQIRQRPPAVRPGRVDSLVRTLSDTLQDARPRPPQDSAAVASNRTEPESASPTPPSARSNAEDSARSQAAEAASRRTSPQRRTVRRPQRVERSIDSVAVDSVATESDRSRPDAPASAADSVATAPYANGADGSTEGRESPGVRSDTLQMDTLQRDARAPVRADSLRPARTLLQLLASRYPDSPQAARAQSMLEAMPEPVDPAPGDSVLADTASADTVSADGAVAGAGSATGAAADTSEAGTSRASRRSAPNPRADGAPNAPSSTPDSASASRRWAILVGPFPDRATAGRRRDSLQSTGAGGYSLRVRPDTAAASYDVLIGTFESQREAAAARVRLRDTLPGSSRLTRVAADSTAASGRSE